MLRSDGVLLDAQAELLHPVERLVEAPSGQHVVQRGDVVGDAVQPRVLRQVAEAALHVDDAALGLRRPAQHLQQAGLPGAVAADQADLVLGAHRERHALHERDPADLDGNVPDLQHRTRVPGAVPTPTIRRGSRAVAFRETFRPESGTSVPRKQGSPTVVTFRETFRPESGTSVPRNVPGRPVDEPGRTAACTSGTWWRRRRRWRRRRPDRRRPRRWPTCSLGWRPTRSALRSGS